MLEVSLVRKGAREACFVTAFEEEGQRTHFRRSASAGAQPEGSPHADPWALFELR